MRRRDLLLQKEEEEYKQRQSKVDGIIYSQDAHKLSNLNNANSLIDFDYPPALYLLFSLLVSLNQGNSGNYSQRFDMAKKQLEDMVNAGIDIDELYNTLIGS